MGSAWHAHLAHIVDGILAGPRRRAAIAQMRQIGAADHEILLLPAGGRCDVLHDRLQFAVHHGILRGVRVERVRLIGGRVQLRVQQAGRQNRVQGAVAAAAGANAIAAAVRVLWLIAAATAANEIVIVGEAGGIGAVGADVAAVGTVRIGGGAVAQVRRICGQQIVLDRRLGLRRVAQAARPIVAAVQVVVVGGGQVSRNVNAVGAVERGLRQVAVVVGHLAGRTGANQAAQVLVQVVGCGVRQHCGREGRNKVANVLVAVHFKIFVVSEQKESLKNSNIVLLF